MYLQFPGIAKAMITNSLFFAILTPKYPARSMAGLCGFVLGVILAPSLIAQFATKEALRLGLDPVSFLAPDDSVAMSATTDDCRIVNLAPVNLLSRAHVRIIGQY